MRNCYIFSSYIFNSSRHFFTFVLLFQSYNSWVVNVYIVLSQGLALFSQRCNFQKRFNSFLFFFVYTTKSPPCSENGNKSVQLLWIINTVVQKRRMMLHNMFTSFSPAASASVFIFKALCFSYRLRVLICMEKLDSSEEWMLFYNRVCIQGFSSRFEVECMYETTDSSTSHAYFWGWL